MFGEGSFWRATVAALMQKLLSQYSTPQLAAVALGSLTSLWLLKKTYNFICKKDRVKGAIVVVSGGSEGVGANVVEQCIARGAAEVHIVSRSKEKLEAIVNKLKNKFPNTTTLIETHSCDCSKIEDVKRLRSEMNGKVPNILVNSAGLGKWRFLHEMEFEEINLCMSAPAMAGIYLIRAFLPDMLEKARQKNSKDHFTIVNVQSPAAYCPWPAATAYVISRYAFRGVYEALRQDLSSMSDKFTIQEHVFGMITDSSYFTTNTGSQERVPTFGKLFPGVSSSHCAKFILDKVDTDKTGVFASPYLLNIGMALCNLMPETFKWVARITGERVK